MVNLGSELLREPRLLMPGQKPLGLVKVKRDNPLGKGLSLATLFQDSLTEQVQGVYRPMELTLEGGSRVVTEKGPGYRPTTVTATTTNAITFDNLWQATQGRSSNGSVTLAVEFTVFDQAGDETGLVIIGEYGGADGCYLHLDTDGTICLANGYWRNNVNTSYSVTYGKWYRALARFAVIGGTATGHLFVDGVYIGENLDVGDTYDYDSTAEIGRTFNGHYGDSLNGVINDCFIWNRWLPDSEVYSFFADSYQFLVPA